MTPRIVVPTTLTDTISATRGGTSTTRTGAPLATYRGTLTTRTDAPPDARRGTLGTRAGTFAARTAVLYARVFSRELQ